MSPFRGFDRAEQGTDQFVTRYAPSPTGRLHLGHVANAMYVWGMARLNRGRVILRMEDHDRGRSRAAHEDSILEDLEWLGFMPDLGTLDEFRAGPTPFRQSDCAPHYENALAALVDQGLVYACDCSRSRIAASGDAKPGEEVPYDGYCRDRSLPIEPGLGLRVRMPAARQRFTDMLLGEQLQDPVIQCGDMLLRDRLGNWTYQFTVVIDDWRQGVNVVIRGEDLLSSTGRQIALQSLMSAGTPTYLHHPLIQEHGRKLSKREGDLSLARLRMRGVSPALVLGQAGFLVGLVSDQRAITVRDLPDIVGPMLTRV